MTKYSLLLLCLLASLWTRAQTEDLRVDADFFQEQTKVYQRWLDHAGFGQYLRVYELDVEADELSVYLAFPFSDVDSVLTAWEALKDDFESQSSLSLEQQLFYKASALFEVEQTMINVQVYDTYDLTKEPLFFREIYFKEGQVQLEKSGHKSKRETIQLTPPSTGSGKESSKQEFKDRYTKEKVFSCIFAFVKESLGGKTCSGSAPQITLLEDYEVLRFEVQDLCQEVLKDESNPKIAEWLTYWGYETNWMKRELLRFTVSYEETMSGFRLIIELDGKVGSGLYRSVGRRGYRSMEIDFDEELENYSDRFSTELRRHLLNNCQE